MTFLPIDPDTIKVGSPITKELFDIIKDNFADLDARASAVETSSGSVFILNKEFSLAGLDSSDPNIFYFKANRNLSITEFRGQIFNKNLITFGTLSLDLQKSTDTNNANFNSMLSSVLSFNFASDAHYATKIATIDSSLANIVTGNVLRVKVTATPTRFGGRILLFIGAE